VTCPNAAAADNLLTGRWAPGEARRSNRAEPEALRIRVEGVAEVCRMRAEGPHSLGPVVVLGEGLGGPASSPR